MKHVFVIHSNTVLLSALGAIEKESINPSSIVFLYGRNFSSSIVDPSIHVIDISKQYKYGQTKGFVVGKKLKAQLVQEIDAIIRDDVSENFTLYIPHIGSPLFQALATNCLCSCINLLQEGSVAYITKPLNNPWKVRIVNLFFSTKRFWAQENWRMPNFMRNRLTIEKTYALKSDFFGDLAKKNEVVVWPKLSGPDFTLPSESNVFLFEAAIELGQIEEEVYFNGCKKLIEQAPSGDCFVKFHPNQSEIHKERILSLFVNQKVHILSGNVPFELIMSSSKNLKLYGFTTSLLTFGKDMGHDVISYKNYLRENSKRFDAYCSCQS